MQNQPQKDLLELTLVILNYLKQVNLIKKQWEQRTLFELLEKEVNILNKRNLSTLPLLKIIVIDYLLSHIQKN